MNALFITLLIQLVAALLFFELNFSKRLLLYFNNPNQLGYYALAIANIFFILSHKISEESKKSIYFYNLHYVLIYISSLILIVFSASKAAMLSYTFLILLVLYYDVFKKLTVLKLTVSLIIAIILIGLLAINFKPIQKKVFNSNNIIVKIIKISKENDSSLSARGYDRILNHPEYIIFGAGEGDFKRFQSQHHSELHSTLANILFSYGTIGLLLFILIFYRHRYNLLHTFILMTPLLLYSLTHNGIRSPLFWIALALSILYSRTGKIHV